MKKKLENSKSQTSESRLRGINSQILELQKQAEFLAKTERITAIKEIKSKLNEFNITIDEIVGKAKDSNGIHASKSDRPLKYKKSDTEYWVGRGPKPRWIKSLEAKGESVEKYRIVAA